jgi:hypothetical protein
MKKRTAAVTGAICAVLLTGCASHPDPIIDMQGVDQAALEIDWADCEAYAEEVIVDKRQCGFRRRIWRRLGCDSLVDRWRSRKRNGFQALYAGSRLQGTQLEASC